MAKYGGSHAWRRSRKAKLTIETILEWADAYHRRTGSWPTSESGPIPEANGEKWSTLNGALYAGRRGLPGGTSLFKLLAKHRGVCHSRELGMPTKRRDGRRPLTIKRILALADAYHARTGRWPNTSSGPTDKPGLSWETVHSALSIGQRGLPGGITLAQLLDEKRRYGRHTKLPLRRKKILCWADAYFRREGRWPTLDSGPIAEAPGESWRSVNAALYKGTRGLPGGSSLAKLLNEYRGRRREPLTIRKIRWWALLHFERTGQWPTTMSGPVPESPGRTWWNIDCALRRGRTGLPGGGSLRRLLRRTPGGPKSSCRGGRGSRWLQPSRIVPTKVIEWHPSVGS